MIEFVDIERAPGVFGSIQIGTHLVAEAHPSLGLDALYVQVHGRSACGGPHLDVTFNPTRAGGRKPVRRDVRVAVDGSWRDVSTYLPLNAYGDTYQ